MTQIVKKVSAPYTLLAANSAPTFFTIGSSSTNNAEVVINGNLTVHGNSVVVESNIATVSDNILTLNKDNPTPINLAGIEVDRGTGHFTPQIVWSETVGRWMLDNGSGLEIMSSQTGQSYMTNLIDDTSPQLGGNLDINGFTVTATNNIVLQPGMYAQIDAAIQVKEVTAPPTNVAGYNLVYAAPVGPGGTGLFVTNTLAAGQELVSKRRAIIYSLIF
jgi:hypothetical protein